MPNIKYLFYYHLVLEDFESSIPSIVNLFRISPPPISETVNYRPSFEVAKPHKTTAISAINIIYYLTIYSPIYYLMSFLTIIFWGNIDKEIQMLHNTM